MHVFTIGLIIRLLIPRYISTYSFLQFILQKHFYKYDNLANEKRWVYEMNTLQA